MCLQIYIYKYLYDSLQLRGYTTSLCYGISSVLAHVCSLPFPRHPTWVPVGIQLRCRNARPSATNQLLYQHTWAIRVYPLYVIQGTSIRKFRCFTRHLNCIIPLCSEEDQTSVTGRSGRILITRNFCIYCSLSIVKKKVKHSRYRPGVAQFQEVKVPRFHDNGTGWW